MTNTSFSRVGGLCAILTAVCGSWAFIAFIVGGDVRAHVPASWLIIATLLLQMVAVLGFFWAVRQVGALTWVGLAAWLVGIFLVIVGQVSLLALESSLPKRPQQATEATVRAAPASTLSPAPAAAPPPSLGLKEARL